MGKEIKRFLVNGPAIIEARRAKNFVSRSALLRRINANDDPRQHLDADTLKKYEQSPRKPHRAFLSKLQLLADTLGQGVEVFIISEEELQHRQEKQSIRDCSGTWLLRGSDILVPGHFDYPNGRKAGWKARVTITLCDCEITGEGRDDEDVVRFSGRAEEGGNHIVGTYEILNNRMRIYGAVNLQYLACGKQMKGWYVGRETGQGSVYILGQLDLELCGEAPEIEPYSPV